MERKQRRTPNTEADLSFHFPDENKVWCKDCIFREKDRLGGKVKGATLGLCEVYPRIKPHNVLWDNEECDYYQSEKD